MSLNRPAASSGISLVMVRLLDRSKRLDYMLLTLLAAVPVALSIEMNLFESRYVGEGESKARVFAGYWDSPNFWSLIVVVPALLWSIRWAMDRIAPVVKPWPPPREPAMLALLDTAAGKQVVYGTLRRWLLSPRILLAALLFTVAVNVIDMSGFLIKDYIRPCVVGTCEGTSSPASTEWRNLHRTGEISTLQNLAFVFTAYVNQFVVVLLGFLGGFVLLAHNLCFLRRIYQRRWVPDGQEENFFEIDLNDEDRCFGFREANCAFNTQITLLMAGGVMMLVSRFESAVTWADLMADPLKILPNAGQVMMVAGWFAALLVVSLPALVKLLPRLPFVGNPRASRRVGSYLLEFVSPQRWPFGRNPSQQEIAALAARFASHGFWPTGNNRAAQLFFFALWIGLVVLIAPPLDPLPLFVGSLVVLALLAWQGKTLIFGLLDTSLRYVDDGLVDVPTGPLPDLRLPGRKLDAGVFVSYRREDSAAYTGRLYDYLCDHFQRDQIFIDIHSIAAGQKFGDVLQQKLAGCAAVIVMIGPRWTTASGKTGEPRLMDPNDWVRIEVATALARDILVVPVLVGGAQMPQANDLPDDLAALCKRNAREISDTRWDYDARRLMGELRAAVDDARHRSD